MTRNERRKAARARHDAKLVRLYKASEAADLDARRAIVSANMSKAPERNYYPQSSMASMQSNSHRGYVCRASGGMPRRSALALKAKGSWR